MKLKLLRDNGFAKAGDVIDMDDIVVAETMIEYGRAIEVKAVVMDREKDKKKSRRKPPRDKSMKNRNVKNKGIHANAKIEGSL